MLMMTNIPAEVKKELCFRLAVLRSSNTQVAKPFLQLHIASMNTSLRQWGANSILLDNAARCSFFHAENI